MIHKIIHVYICIHIDLMIHEYKMTDMLSTYEFVYFTVCWQSNLFVCQVSLNYFYKFWHWVPSIYLIKDCTVQTKKSSGASKLCPSI